MTACVEHYPLHHCCWCSAALLIDVIGHSLPEILSDFINPNVGYILSALCINALTLCSHRVMCSFLKYQLHSSDVTK